MRHALIKGSPLLVYPNLAMKIGLKEAIILQQIHYWLDSKRNNHFYEDRYWVHNTYKEWQLQFPFWGLRTIQRSISNLEKRGLLVSHISHEFKKTKFYTIHYEQLDNLSGTPKKTSKIIEIIPSRQNGPLPQSNCPAHGQAVTEERTPSKSQSKSMLDNSPSGQFVHEKRSICPRSRQSGTIHHDKVARSYNTYTETTTETTLLSPLTPPSSNSLCLRQEEEEDLKSMLTVWDETIYQILNPGKRLHLTEERKGLMLNLLKGLFEGKLAEWKAYCQTIAGCSFLMGKNAKQFKVTLDWALSPRNVLKVLENDFFSEPVDESETLKELPWKKYVDLLRVDLKEWPFTDEWLQICEALFKKLGQATFNVWFRQLRPRELTNETVCLLAPNGFVKDYIQREYMAPLRTCVTTLFPLNKSITIDVDANLVMDSSNTITKGDKHE